MPTRRPAPPQSEPVAEPASEPGCCRNVGATMVGHFATRLEVEAAKAGGSLTANQIRVLARRFVELEQGRFAGYYRRAWDECTQERDALRWEGAREMPLDRIVMRRFAHLFPPRGGDEGGEGILSRRMIPGFHAAIEMMIGPAMVAQCHQRAASILERHRRRGGGYDWRAIHADAEAAALTDEILMAAAQTFADFNRRRTWFLDLVNSRLAAARNGAADEHWRLTESAFATLMRALFADLGALAHADPGQVRARWGDSAWRALSSFILHLERPIS